MGVSSGRPRVAELTFHVFGRTVHPDWFTTRVHRRVGLGDWEADLRIIDGGHAISFRRGPMRFTEVLCGPETALPEEGLLIHTPVGRDRTATLGPGGSVEYLACLDVERVDPEVFAHLGDEMTLDTSAGRLFHRFKSHDRTAPAPITHLRFDARIGGLTLHAFHSFPEEHAVVRTQSLVERSRTV